MLILTRRHGEILRIGDDVSLRIVEIRGNEVLVGIHAPRSVTILREEIYEKFSRPGSNEMGSGEAAS